MRQHHLLLALAGTLAACARPPPAPDAEAATRLATAPSWAMFQPVITYHQRTDCRGVRGDVVIREEATFGPLTSAGQTVAVVVSQPAPDGPEAETAYDYVVDGRGLRISLKRTTVNGVAHAQSFRPPKLVVPGPVNPRETWTDRRYDGVTGTASLAYGSPFCDDGVVVTRRYALPGGVHIRTSDHWCPGQGWRGHERIDHSDDGQRCWLWTERVVADDMVWHDPPLTERFFEGAPPS